MGSLVEMGLINALLAGALAVVALVVGRISRRPALVHCLWVLVLIKLVTPPLIAFPVPGWRVAEPILEPIQAPVRETVAVVGLPIPPIEEPPVSNAAFMKLEDLALMPGKIPERVEPLGTVPGLVLPPAVIDEVPVVAIAVAPRPGVRVADLVVFSGWLWLAGAIVCFLVTISRIWKFQTLLKHARPAPLLLQQQAAILAERLGLGRCPAVYLLPGAVPPLLWAVGGRARLFFPSSLLGRLQEPGKATLLVHELAHLARRDHWVRWLELVVGCLYWWYPIVWLARQRLQAAEEECCDAWVTNELPEYRPAYAGALLETVDFLACVPAPFPPAASGFGRVHQLKRRLTMIVRGSTPRGLSWIGKAVVLALALGLPLVPSPARTAAPPPADAEKQDATDKQDEAAEPATEPSQYQNNPRVFQGGNAGQVWQVRLSPDGKSLAVASGGTGDNEGALTLYDFPSGKERASVTESKPIRCVGYSPDGTILATGDFENNIKLRDPKTGAVTKELKGHSGAVNSLVFTPDGKTLISASLDKSIKVWDVGSGKNTHTLTDHTDWVLSVAISRDGKTLVSTSRDQTARIWDAAKFESKHILKGHTNWVECCAISPDDKMILTAGLDGLPKLWDANTGKHVRDLAQQGMTVASATFFGDGKRVALGVHDRTVRLLDVASGNVEQTIDNAHENVIYAIAVTADDKTLISGSWDRVVKVWDAETREEKKQLRARRYSDDLNFPLLSLAASPDGKYLAVAGEEKVAKIVDATSGALLHLLEGHEDIVGGVAFSNDSKIVATAGFDGKVMLWDVATGKKKETLDGHENWVFSVAYSPDGKYLASAGYDRTIRIWDAKTGKHQFTLTKHKGGVRNIAWSADSARLASGGTDKVVMVWDVAKKEVLYTLKGHEDAIRGVAFLPDGKRLLSASEDQTVRLWDIETDKTLATHRHRDVIRGMALSPKGRSLVIVAQDRSMQLLDPTNLTQRMIQFSHTEAATCCAFSSDGRALYTGSSDRTIRRWQAALEARAPTLTYRDGGKQMWVSSYSPDGKWLLTAGSDKVLRARPVAKGTRPWSLNGLDQPVYGMAVSPDGETLATGLADNTLKLWNIKTGRLKATLGESGKPFSVWMMAFSPDGKKLACVSGSWNQAGEPGEAKVWDLSGDKPKELGKLPEHGSPVMALAWSKDGKHIVTGARDGSARLVDAGTLKEKFDLKGHTEAARYAVFSPDDKYVATASFDGTVKIWSVAEGKEVTSVKAHEKGVNCVAWSPDGKQLATNTRPGDGVNPPGEVKLWNVETPDDGPMKITQRSVLKGHIGHVLACAFSPDGKTLASVGGVYSQYGEAIVWDVATAKERMFLHGHRLWCECVTFGKDGATLFTGGGTSGSRGEVRAWNVGPNGWTVENAHKGEVTCATWSKDGKLLATGCTNSGIKVWDAATGEMKMELTGHKKMVRSLAFSPDGKTLASSSSDNTVRLWDLEGQTEAIELARHRLNIMSVAFSPDGTWLVTASADPTYADRTGETKVFNVKTGKERPTADWSNQAATCVAYSPDGKTLATGNQGANQLKLYDAESGKLVRTVNGANSIRALAWSPDSKRIATTHGPQSPRGNGSIQVWDAKSGQEVMALVGHTTMCLGISYSHDGKRLASASNDGTVKVWDLTGVGIPVVAQATRAPVKE